MPTLQEQFGQIDIYLFDQLLKGRITPGMRILDAGCGSGRNLVYFLREGYEVYAADSDAQAVESVRSLARMFAPALPASNFRVEPVEHMSFDDACADVVISNTVLHLAQDDAQFESMLQGSWRVLKPGGLFSAALHPRSAWRASSNVSRDAAFNRRMARSGIWWTKRCCGSITERLGGELAEPLKTTVVQNQRSMTTWVLRKKLL